MSQAISGVNADVTVGSADADVQGWSLEIDVNTFDSTTTADAGFEDVTAATKKVSGSFEFFYNVTKKPTGGTLTLTPGTIAAITCYVDKINQPGETFSGSGLITKLSLKTKVKDGFMGTASFQGKGPWTFPS